MKTYKFLLLFLVVALTSCYEDYVNDFETPNMGFAMEKPLRTVVAERDMPIYIGVSIGGKREVDLNDWAKFVIDESLLSGTGLELLPSSYYTLEDPELMKVRKKNLPVADVKITFTDAFYSDPKCKEKHYALPFRMLDNSFSSIREGAETTIAVIKYVSTFAGTYYRLGSVTEVDANGAAIGEKTNFGNSKDINKCSTVAFETTAPRSVSCTGLGSDSKIGGLQLDVDVDGNLSVAGKNIALVDAKGTYREQGDFDFVAEPGTKAPQFTLDYVYESNGKFYHVEEVLILRQDVLKDLRVETW